MICATLNCCSQILYSCACVGRALGLAVLPLVVFGLSYATHAVSSLASFLCGAAFGYFCKIHHTDREMACVLGALVDFLSNVVWFLAGQFLVTAFRVRFKWQWVLIAFACLVPLRMGTVFIALAYSGLDWKSQVLHFRCMYSYGITTAVVSL